MKWFFGEGAGINDFSGTTREKLVQIKKEKKSRIYPSLKVERGHTEK